MEALENIRTRRSIRKFTDEPVDHATLEKIVEAASWSPSWKNTQIVRYIAIEDPALKAKIAKDCTGLAALFMLELQALFPALLAQQRQRCLPVEVFYVVIQINHLFAFLASLQDRAALLRV